ncbi:hypothetical protein ACOMHN_040985 [Nucella lapillus]
MTEPIVEAEDGHFQRYTPQHPLPDQIRNMTRDDTVCQYCGVSYLIHTEIKKLEDKLKATEKELEHYKGREDRESRLQGEKEELLTRNTELQETLASRDNVVSMLKQELRLASEASASLEARLQEATAAAEKYRQQYTAVLQKFSPLTSVVQQQRQTLEELRQSTQTFRDSANRELNEAHNTVKEMTGKVHTDLETLQSQLQCLEMEHMVATQSNRTLTSKLRSQEEKVKNLQLCEQEMESLETQNKDLQTTLSEVQGQLAETVARERHLQMEAEQFQKQIRSKTEEVERLVKDKQQQAHNSDAALRALDHQLRQKEGELSTVQKQLKTLENKHREVERRQADVAQQRVLSENEAKNLKESLEQACSDVEALKNEREMMIEAHQVRIEELRDSFKRKMADNDRWPEKLQAVMAEEQSKRQSELTALEARLKESFVMELKIEKEKYDELLNKYQAQSKERNLQKAAEMADVEARHRRELEAVQLQVAEARKLTEQREVELRKEIDSLKRIISELQDKLGRFESRGEEQAGELSRELEAMRSQLKASQEKAASLSTALQQTKEEVQFLQDTVRNECEERFELTEALSEARQQLLALKRPNGGHHSGSNVRTPPHNGENGLAPIRKSASISSLQSVTSSAHSDDANKHRHGGPTAQVNVSYKGDNSKTPRKNGSGTVDDNRRRISALLGRP